MIKERYPNHNKVLPPFGKPCTKLLKGLGTNDFLKAGDGTG